MDVNYSGWSRRDTLMLGGVAAAVTMTKGTASAKAAVRRPVAKLFMTDVGRGRNVLLIHGWVCDSNDWSWQLPTFEGKYRTVAVDLRGHGRSEVKPSGSYMPTDYVADIEALMVEKARGEKFVVMGHSMGGQIAARVAAKRPDLVAGVVSVDGALGFDGPAVDLFAKTNHNLMAENPAAAAEALFKLAYAPTTDPALERWHGRRVEGMPPDVVRESFGPLFFGPGQVGVGAASAAFCKSLTVPVYHLCRDPAQADRMRPWFTHPKSQVDLWPHSGHWIMQDRAEAMTLAASDWIDAL
ncbi:alpha/beta fold hydrolase [Hephaestia mangrovi]|uniref:alpha/beta fold hydrolase n=1 Tax=Hephaestia mangrovi TaxID=2873268 RepID=UPI001CA72C1E|nr:alpha/beta hydrolase [Hephaestia mangrovi]MBY8829849.1 alpha/beta hydrolase [Hephaestia mangrovi]